MANTHCKVKNGATGKAVAHANYISALGKYQAKEGEVVLLLHGNMPSFSVENPTDFWLASDEFGQASYMAIHKRKADGHQIIDGVKTPFKKGDDHEKTFHSRAYKEIEFSIPREIVDLDKQKQFAQEFAMKIAGKTQPFTLAVHNTIALDGLPNCHAHLMLSEKMVDGVEREREMFFKKPSMPYRHRVTKELIPADPAKGGAAKNRAMHEIDFVKGVRETYQVLAKSYGVELDMRSNAEQWLGEPEPKLGPVNARSGENQSRAVIQQTINQIRTERKENEHSAAASVNAIGKNISRASRAGQFSKPDFTGITENLRAAIGLASNNDGHPQGVAKATSQYKHAREVGGIAQAAGKAFGGIIKEITRAASRIEASLKAQAAQQAADALAAQQAAKALEAIETIETVQSITLPQKSLTERIAESLEAMLNWVKGNGNGDGALKEIDLERSENEGRIVQLGDYHAVQNLGKSSAVHEIERLDFIPQLGSMVNIKYKDGRGTVQIEAERSSKGKGGIAD